MSQEVHLSVSRHAPQRAQVSVIIPALNEEATITAAIRSASESGVEVVVVDGGSTDRTVAVAAETGVQVISAQRGRSFQMNAGAAVSRGEVLLFLHADTTLPQGFVDTVLGSLEQPSVSLLAFRLSIKADGWRYRLIEKAVSFRSRILRMPYGDQALSIRAQVFRDIGGFPDVPIMEDYALVRNLRRMGRIAVARQAVVTSARRWLNRGVWRTTITNQACIMAYLLGIPATRIVRWREEYVAPVEPSCAVRGLPR